MDHYCKSIPAIPFFLRPNSRTKSPGLARAMDHRMRRRQVQDQNLHCFAFCMRRASTTVPFITRCRIRTEQLREETPPKARNVASVTFRPAPQLPSVTFRPPVDRPCQDVSLSAPNRLRARAACQGATAWHPFRNVLHQNRHRCKPATRLLHLPVMRARNVDRAHHSTRDALLNITAPQNDHHNWPT
ncbi:hypothetical protein BC567DRAFT_90979 [Phyllosticta citribraziliensis]